MKSNIELGRLLSEMLQERIQEPESMNELEQALREQLMEIGRQALTDWIHELKAEQPARSVPCPYCEQEAKYERQRPGQLRTMLGVLSFKRAYYHCQGCGRGHYPLDQRLGLRPNAMSAELERLAGMTGVQIPFAQGSDLFKELALVELSVSLHPIMYHPFTGNMYHPFTGKVYHLLTAKMYHSRQACIRRLSFRQKPITCRRNNGRKKETDRGHLCTFATSAGRGQQPGDQT